MAQTLSSDLLGYLVCCSTSDGIPLEETPPLPKFLFLGDAPAPLSIIEIMIDYEVGNQDSSIIEGIFSVPTVGLIEIQISYGEEGVITTDNIFIDTTSSISFWVDINGWLQMNNFHELIYDAGLDKWLISDPVNLAYVKITQV